MKYLVIPTVGTVYQPLNIHFLLETESFIVRSKCCLRFLTTHPQQRVKSISPSLDPGNRSPSRGLFDLLGRLLQHLQRLAGILVQFHRGDDVPQSIADVQIGLDVRWDDLDKVDVGVFEGLPKADHERVHPRLGGRVDWEQARGDERDAGRRHHERRCLAVERE